MNWLDWWLARLGIEFIYLCLNLLVNFFQDLDDREAFGVTLELIVFDVDCGIPENLGAEFKADEKPGFGGWIWEG